MYYRSPCLFFRNTVWSASSCFRVRQDHYGARGLWPDHARARGLWPDHARARGLWPDHACARGFARPLSDHSSGTSSLASHARGLPRPPSDHDSWTSSLAPRPVLGDCLDHSPTTVRGLSVSTTCDWRLAYSWDIFSHLDLATRLIPRLPASSGTISVRCTCRCILYRLYDDSFLNLTGNSF